MKKWMAIFLAMALCATMTGAAFADDTATVEETVETVETTDEALDETFEATDEEQANFFTGTILEIDLENGEMLLHNAEMGEVLMRFENTLLEGLPTLFPGVTVTFETTGIATMSLPAQMNAVGVECIYIAGAFKGFEEGMMLVESDEMGMIAANLGAGPRVYGLENMAADARVTVFFNGMMTRSIPAQIVADVIVFEGEETVAETEIEGEIETEIEAEGIEEETEATDEASDAE